MELVYKYLFWSSVFAILFTYILYPIVTLLLARISPLCTQESELYEPTVTAILIVHNESTRLEARINNILNSDYPRDKLSLIVIDDGSTDGTEVLMSAISSQRIQYIRNELNVGKPHHLSSVIPNVTSDICVLCDARQLFASDAIRRLASAFFDPDVGAISGELIIASSTSTVGLGIDKYWSSERRLRQAESQRHSAIGCTGAIYAIRRCLFKPIPSDTILDDVVIPLQIASEGCRILHDSKACAFDNQPLDPKFELRRKRRTLAGNFQMLFRYPSWLLPWGHPLWWRIIAHKYLRIFAPLFLCVAALSSLMLSGICLYRICAILQCIVYLLGILGLIFKSRVFIISIPSAFLFLNYIVVLAFKDFLFSRVSAKWETGTSVMHKR